MSRYFEPIRRRLQARQAASAGGKASAAVRKAKNGTAQPLKVVRDEAREPLERNPSDVEATPEATVEATPEATPKPAGSGAEAAVSGQRSTPLNNYYLGPPQNQKEPLGVNVTPPPQETRDAWTAEEFWRWAQHKRWKAGLGPERWPHPAKLSAWWSEARSVCSVKRLQEAFYRFGDTKKWQQAIPPLPWAAFASQWNQYLPQEAPND